MTRQQRRAKRRQEEKLTTSMNTLKPGLDVESQFVAGESREDFAKLKTEHYDHYRPANPEERYQVDTLIRTEWFLRRFARVEDELWDYHAQQAGKTGVALGEAFTKASPVFMRLQRRIDAAQKTHKEAKAELDRLKSSPQPQQTTQKSQQLASFPNFKESDTLDMMNLKMDLFMAGQSARNILDVPKEADA